MIARYKARLAAAVALACLAPFAMAQQAPPAAPAATVATPPASDRVVVTGEVPVPNVGAGAPYHSAQEIETITSQAQASYNKSIENERRAWDSEACESPFSTNVMNGNKPVNLEKLAARPPGRPPNLQDLYAEVKAASARVAAAASKAADATKAADQSRRDAATGAIDAKAVEQLELARQTAVNTMQKARAKLMEAQATVADYGDLKMSGRNPIDWADLDGRALLRKKQGWGTGLPNIKQPPPLAVLTPAMQEMQDAQGSYLRVQMILHNTSNREIDIPDMIVSAVDERGFALSTEAAHAEPRIKIKADGYKPFQYDFRPAPRHVAGVLINFADGFEPPPELPASLLCPKDPPS